MKLQEIREKGLAGVYINDIELLNDCKQAIKDDFGFSSILTEKVIVRSYSNTNLETLELIEEIISICEVIKLVQEVK